MLILYNKQRAEIVANIKCVDLVIPENNWEQKIEDIKKYNVDIFAIGEDWKGKFDFLKEYCEVVYLPRTEGISSTQIRKVLKNFSVSKDEIIKAFEILEQLREEPILEKISIYKDEIIKAFEILEQLKKDLE